MSEAPRNVEKQGDKADELQKQIIEGKTGKEELPPKEVAPVKDSEDVKKAEDEDKKVEVPNKADESLKEIKTDEEDFKQKYLVLQGMIKSDNARHATEIARLNQALEDATQTINNLNSTISSAQQSKKADDEEGQVEGEIIKKAPDTQSKLNVEDFDGYGQEMSELVKLANAQAVELRQLKAQMGTVEKQVGDVGQSIAVSAEDRFYNALEKAVPDWHAINKDPKWLEWLGQVDSLTGRSRQQFLDEARDAFDVKRTANFFTAFKGGNGGVTSDEVSSEVQDDALGEQVMPEQSGAGEGSDLQLKVKTVTYAQYQKAVKDAQTARITEEEFNKIANQYQRQTARPAQ